MVNMGNSQRATRIIYVDDSGAEQTGFVTFSWLSVTTHQWVGALSDILDWRSELVTLYQIPKKYEIHSTNFVNGRGRPSMDESWNRRKSLRWGVYDEAFTRFAEWEWLSHGTVYSKTTARRTGYELEKQRVYGCLVESLDEWLRSRGEYGILIMDGNGTDSGYTAAHRKLDIESRALLEDPSFQSASGNQWVQLADMLAYSAYEAVVRLEEKRFAWDWYSRLDRSLIGFQAV